MFSRQGAKVLLVSRDQRNAEGALSKIKEEGGEASFFAGDLTDIDSCQRMVAAAVESHGKLDVVVNNVGTTNPNPTSVTDVDGKFWDTVMEANLKSVMLTSKYAIPEMINVGGGSFNNSHP